jgi:hypothetical protein
MRREYGGIPLAAGRVRRFDGPSRAENHAMGHGMGRIVRAAAVALCAALSGCGSGSSSGAYATISFDNDPLSTHSIVQVDFDFYDITLLPDRVASVDVAPGESVGFDFDQYQTENLFDVTLTWDDSTTTVISLVPIILFGGGDLSYPVSH